MLSLTLHLVLLFLVLFISNVINSLVEERAGLYDSHACLCLLAMRYVLLDFLFSWLWFVIVALPGLFI